VNIFNVLFNEKLKRSLKKLPIYIVIKLEQWISAVAHDGLLEVRKQLGYHDEPLKGKRKGQRSIRLSKSYRAIYEINEKGETAIIEIVEVNKHDY
jgi:toxin HigB-1